MNDLVWIGNTLYPRWAVLAAVFGFILAYGIACTIVEAVVFDEDEDYPLITFFWPIWIIPWLLYHAAVWVAGRTP